ncbi:hypothetical protein [Pararhodospirillum oryzae]|uniref:Uncharacterized protein n=1 Tax=Pararhodospirillum oryzae TaxID=478448 RepID=A0A512H7U3_9PROT|nr:hypothetical protein [Pararhodospirillum oryzae]GEO81529.1 hypothetical protein ROR02_16600 [Pararhodospirillum oryzae]
MSDRVTFADGIGGIGFIAHTLRIDLVRFDPTQKEEDGSPARVPCHTLVLTETGFLELLNALQQTHQRLVSLQGQAQPAAAPAAPAAPQTAVSPNFPTP